MTNTNTIASMIADTLTELADHEADTIDGGELFDYYRISLPWDDGGGCFPRWPRPGEDISF